MAAMKRSAFTGQGMHISALDDAEMCVSIDAKCVEGWLEKGKAEMGLGRALDAAQSFHQGLQLAPEHQDLKDRFAAARAEPSPNILHQFKDLVFAARLGLETLFRTLEDPQKTNDAFVESNLVVLDAQLGLLAQTLHVNTSVLFESPRLCDAYDQIVRACSQLVAGAPGAFSRRLQHAESITRGLCLAVRIGWHIHHGIAKHAATALIMLALCPSADEALRRLAVKQLLGGLLRWLLDARPEPDREGEEVCGCNCPVPWKAAACFLERLLEPRAQLVQQECESWPDTVQLCQWLTLSVRDYHATPLGLVALLQMPGVASKAMKSQAKVDFFIAPHIFGDDFGDPLDESGDEKEDDWDSPEDTLEAASQSDVPWWRAAQMSRQPLRAWRQQLRFVAAAAAAAEATSSTAAAQAAAAASQAPVQVAPILGELDALRWLPDPPPPPAQRLGEWLMNSLGYLFLFIEGDALFTVYACQALQTLARADAEEDGRTRLLQGLWLGLPLLSKLSLAACTNTAALDLFLVQFAAWVMASFDDSAFHSFCMAQKGSWKGQGVNEFIAHFLKLEMQHTLDQKQEEHARETSRRKAQEELAYQHLNMTQQGHLTEQDAICKEYQKSFEDSHTEAEKIYVSLCLFLVRRLPSHGLDLRLLESGEATPEEAARVAAEAFKLNEERRQKWSGWYQEVESWKRNDSEEELAIFESILSQRPDIAEMVAYKESEGERLEQDIQNRGKVRAKLCNKLAEQLKMMGDELVIFSLCPPKKPSPHRRLAMSRPVLLPFFALLALAVTLPCFVSSGPRSGRALRVPREGTAAPKAATTETPKPTEKPKVEAPKSVALVQVTKENTIATAGVLGGLTGLLLGGFWIGAAGFVATSYLAKKDDDVSAVLKGVSSASLEALNYVDSLNQKYEAFTN
eukprot:s39_g23.t1